MTRTGLVLFTVAIGLAACRDEAPGPTAPRSPQVMSGATEPLSGTFHLIHGDPPFRGTGQPRRAYELRGDDGTMTQEELCTAYPYVLVTPVAWRHAPRFSPRNTRPDTKQISSTWARRGA